MSKISLLIVEDNDELRKIYKTIMDFAFPDYSYELTENGQLAFNAFKADPSFKLVITDMNMPDVTGMKLFQMICALCEEENISLPGFLFVSGVKKALDLIHQVSKEVICMQLIKPFSTTQFMNAVTEIIEKVSPVQEV